MENQPVQRRELPMAVQAILLCLWGILSLFMLLAAVLGLICLILGTISLFVEGQFLDLQFASETVRTTTQKLLFTGFSATLCILGSAFWWLRQRGYIVAALIMFTLLWGLLAVIGWATGSGNLISVGW